MKILFFSDSLKGGGAERVLTNLANELARCNHEVTMALNVKEILYELNQNITVITATEQQVSPLNSIVSRAIRYAKLKRSFYRHTKNVIKSVRPDVIVTFLQCNIKHIIRSHKNIPIILSEHNAFDRKLGFNNYFNRFWLSRFFDKVCVLTPFDQGFACAKGLKNTIVMPNPNSFDSISEDVYKHTFPQRKNILVCGRLDVWYIKGIDISIEVLSKISSQFPDVDLDIAGGGNDSSIKHLEKMAERLGIKERIHFLGQCDDIKKLMQNHQLFILSSRTEGFPMVLTEAMSQGLPCIAFERLASSIIVNGIDGFLVNDGDVVGMSESVSYMLSNKSLCYQMGFEAANNVKRFSAESIGKRWEKLFIELTDK